MTQEKFLKMLANPEELASISYEELKTIVLAYPYAHNLRYLLALKSQQENRPDATRTLATAAAYSLDRTKLFLLHAPKIIVPVREAVAAEVLELKPIEVVQRELEALTPQKHTEVAGQSAALAAPVPVVPPVPVVLIPKPETIRHPALTPTLFRRQSFLSWMSQFHSPVLQVSAPALRTANTPVFSVVPQLVPSPHRASETAEEALLRMRSSDEEEDQINEATPSALEALPRIPQTFAERSVTENRNLVSEPLARLLAKQGHREKAIAMYEKLCLVFPERSATFAAEIELLKK